MEMVILNKNEEPMIIATITGIRPDFIRMSKVFEKLDENFEHIMIHSGQHYDDELNVGLSNSTLQLKANSLN